MSKIAQYVVRLAHSRPCETSAEVAEIVREYMAANPEDTLVVGVTVWDYSAGRDKPEVRSPLEFLSAQAGDASRSTRSRRCDSAESRDMP